MEVRQVEVPVMADLHAHGEQPEYLFWVGCAGAFDDRYQKVTRAFTKILTFLGKLRRARKRRILYRRSCTPGRK